VPLSLILETEPAIKHLIITCNQEGRLSEAYKDDPRVKLVVLDDQTNDRSLVMTSSFTNMVLASRSLGLLRQPKRYRELAQSLHDAADRLLRENVNAIAAVARENFGRALFLASGPRIGAAREAALKLLEMTSGRVMATSETYLGLRHGPMSAVHDDTLIVCFLSSGSPAREYECDLIRELQRKQLGSRKIIFGAGIPKDLVSDRDLAVECSALAEVGDDNASILDILLGQLLGFFRCIEEGLTPDCPSESGVINRVVEEFALHLTKTGA
jgi:tagatose-6-phosphate ketose/aldose isomerase